MQKQHKKKRLIALNVKIALALFLGGAVLAVSINWGRIWTYHE